MSFVDKSADRTESNYKHRTTGSDIAMKDIDVDGGDDNRKRSRGVVVKHVRTVIASDMLDDIVNNNMDTSDSSKPVIQLDNVSVANSRTKFLFTRATCFESLNISFHYGRIFALIGSKQTGKSSLLQTIAKVIAPVKGKVRYSCMNYNQTPLSVGFMPQQNGFFSELTPVENIHYLARLFCVNKLVVHHKLHRMMQMVGWDKKNVRMSALEPIQQTLVSLTLSSLHSPAILILDEPNFGSDLFLKEHIWTQLKHLTRQEYVTIIFSTSIVEDVRFADEAAIVRGGSLYTCSLDECQKNSKSISEMTDEECASIQNFDIQNLLTVDVNKIRHFVTQSFASELQTESTEDVCKETANIGKMNPAFETSMDDIQLEISSSSWSNEKDHYRKSQRKRLHQEQPLMNKLGLVLMLLVKLFLKRPVSLIGQLLVPALMILTFNHFVGKNPHNIAVAVYNPDKPSLASQHVVKSIDHNTIKTVDYSTLDQAIDALRNHLVWAVIEFPANYTNSMINQAIVSCEANDDFEDEPEAETISGHLFEKNDNSHDKLREGREEIESESRIVANRTRSQVEYEESVHHNDTDNEDLSSDLDVNRKKTRPINMITIRIYVDNTNLLISGFVKGKVFQALQRAHKDASIHQFGPQMPPPVEIVSPNIYGRDETPMSEFLLPGTLVSILFICVSVLPLAMLIQIQSRSVFQMLNIVGISQMMLVCAWILIQLVLLILQITFCIGILLLMSFVEIRGPLSFTFILLYIQGTLAIIGTVIIQWLLSGNGLRTVLFYQCYFTFLMIFGGIFWPLECLPQTVTSIMHYFPQPIAAETLRYIFSRGWSYADYFNKQNPIISSGVNVPLVWLSLMIIIMVLIIKFKH